MKEEGSVQLILYNIHQSSKSASSHNKGSRMICNLLNTIIIIITST